MSERMTLADAVLELAREQLGVSESGGPNQGLPSVRYMGGRIEPWCGHLIAWLFREVGAPIPDDVVPTIKHGNPLAGVKHLERVCRAHGWQVAQPVRGDIIVFSARGASDHGRGMHVGLVERVGLTSIATIEGNTGDAVRRRNYYRPSLDAIVSSYMRRPEPEGWVYKPLPVRFPR